MIAQGAVWFELLSSVLQLLGDKLFWNLFELMLLLRRLGTPIEAIGSVSSKVSHLGLSIAVVEGVVIEVG